MFIVIEGLDGAGKTTQAQLLKEKMPDAILLNEPGGTQIGKKIRKILLDPESSMDTGTEVLLFQAARAELHHEVILPALESGKDVILDRWAWSTFAYQGVNIPFAKLRPLIEFATFGCYPDCTILIDIDAEVALKRRLAKSRGDRIERRTLEYHQAVRGNYLDLARIYSDKIKLVSGVESIEEIHSLILKLLETCK